MNNCLAALAASLSILAPTMGAAAPTDPQTRRVPYADLDLSSQADVATLHRRIGRAVNELCTDPTGPSPAAAVDAQCRREILAAARAQIATSIAAARRDDRQLALGPNPPPVRR